MASETNKILVKIYNQLVFDPARLLRSTWGTPSTLAPLPSTTRAPFVAGDPWFFWQECDLRGGPGVLSTSTMDVSICYILEPDFPGGASRSVPDRAATSTGCRPSPRPIYRGWAPVLSLRSCPMIGETMVRVGGSTEIVTGRRRRCGWLDAVARYAVRVGGITGIGSDGTRRALPVRTIRIANAYEWEGVITSNFPASKACSYHYSPVYEKPRGMEHRHLRSEARRISRDRLHLC